MLCFGTAAAHLTRYVCNVYDYGAQGDGITDDAQAIQKALVECSSIMFPKGKFLMSPIRITTNSTQIIITKEATLLSILGSKWNLIPEVPSYPNVLRYEPFISIINATDITITGEGTIDGRGSWWWEDFWVRKLQYTRPMLIEVYQSYHLTIESITLQNSPYWTLRPIYSEDIVIDNVTIVNPADSPTTDGIVIDSSINVIIQNCVLATGGDNISLKSGVGENGRAVNKPCQNITIRNNTFHYGLGLRVGAETAGNIADVLVQGLTVKSSLTAIHFNAPRYRDGGTVENFEVRDVIVQNVLYAIYINQFYADIESGYPKDINPPPKKNITTPTLKDIYFENFKGADNSTSFGTNSFMVGLLQCLPENPCTNISFVDINLTGFKSWVCANIRFGKVSEVFPPIDINRDKCLDYTHPQYHASSWN